MTTRLYHDDGYLREFTARVLAVGPTAAGDTLVELDRTAFYPTAGGQPHDTGWLGDYRVVEVTDDDTRILHRVEGAVAHALAEREVAARIDWERRLDHMQQHTGQHILSQAAARALGAETLSVHIGADHNTVDLAAPVFSAADADRLEDVANAVVWENRPVRCQYMDEDEAVRVGLRRPPRKRGLIRVVEVEGFDRSACGGTHLRASGEVGAIVIAGWQRYKQGTRVAFLCGIRAVRGHRARREALTALTRALSAQEHELVEAVERVIAREQEAVRGRGEASQRLVAAEAALRRGRVRLPAVIAELLPGRDLDEIRLLAQSLTAPGGLVALLGTDGGRVVFARSADLPLDLAALLRRAAQVFGGRGGGRAEFAQGTLDGATPLEDALTEVRRWAEGELPGA